MRRTPSSQLSFDFSTVPGTASGRFRPTRVLLNHRACNKVLERLLYVRRFFPELDGRMIHVGLTRAASGMAVQGGDELWINPSHVSYHTMAHELIHLLQGEGGVPAGERSCDVYSMARHWTLNDTPPYYVKIPYSFLDARGKVRSDVSMTLYTTARRAIELRRSGLRNYIAYFEKTLGEGAEAAPRLLLPAAPTGG